MTQKDPKISDQKTSFDKKCKPKRKSHFFKTVYIVLRGSKKTFNNYHNFRHFTFDGFLMVLEMLCFWNLYFNCSYKYFHIAHNSNHLSQILFVSPQIDHLSTSLYLWSHVLNHFQITFSVLTLKSVILCYFLKGIVFFFLNKVFGNTQ